MIMGEMALICLFLVCVSLVATLVIERRQAAVEREKMIGELQLAILSRSPGEYAEKSLGSQAAQSYHLSEEDEWRLEQAMGGEGING